MLTAPGRMHVETVDRHRTILLVSHFVSSITVVACGSTQNTSACTAEISTIPPA